MIIPYGVSESDWFDTTTLDLVQYGVLPRYSGDWAACAAMWLQVPGISSFNIPRPDQFKDWREWASRFNLIVFG